MNKTRQPAWPLGPLEERVLQVVWRHGPCTVRRVLEDLLPEHRLAYTTVMTVMVRLAEKGLLRREAKGGSYTYSPAFSESEYASLVTRRLARDLVARFGDVALVQFAAELERVDPDHLRELKDFAGQDQPE